MTHILYYFIEEKSVNFIKIDGFFFNVLYNYLFSAAGGVFCAVF